MKIGILYICIGKYTYFWDRFYHSAEEYLVPEAEKEYFVFTDAPSEEIVDAGGQERIHMISQENLGWPGNTLYRFRIFQKARELSAGCDYLYFFNSNIEFLRTITAEEFLPEKALMASYTPGYYGLPAYEFPYERRRKSLAAIPYPEGEGYYWGGCNGGHRDAYFQMVDELARRVQMDEDNGIVATWHDESHLNRYLYENKDYSVLPPTFGYPEEKEKPENPAMCILDKKRYIALDAQKSRRQNRKNPFRFCKKQMKKVYLKAKYGKKS